MGNLPVDAPIFEAQLKLAKSKYLGGCKGAGYAGGHVQAKLTKSTNLWAVAPGRGVIRMLSSPGTDTPAERKTMHRMNMLHFSQGREGERVGHKDILSLKFGHQVYLW